MAILQSRIADLLSELYIPRDSTKAFVKGRSIKDNAKPHVRKSFVFNIDIKDFFPSITFARVRGLLISKPYELKKETASVIAHLCTAEGILPQGAPSSPIISNMICSKMDRELISLAYKNKATYTRYADDITFSFLGPAECLPNNIVSLGKISWGNSAEEPAPGKELSSIIESNGFSINKKKTRLQPRQKKQVVTGLTVNKKVNVDRRFVRKTAALIHSIEIHGLESANQVYLEKNKLEKGSILNHIRGRILFIKQIKGVKSKVFNRLAIRYNQIPTNDKLPVKANNIEKPDSNFGKSINKKCWVLESLGDDGSQASGFMIDGNKIITCAHFFTKNAEFTECEGFRLVGSRKRHHLELVYKHDHIDLALLEFKEDPEETFEFIDTNFIEAPEPLDKVRILGFPNYKPGFKGVNIVYARVTNLCAVFGVKHAEVDKDIFDGNSGGPVLNKAQNLVGVVSRGADTKQDHNAFITSEEVVRFLEIAHQEIAAQKEQGKNAEH